MGAKQKQKSIEALKRSTMAIREVCQVDGIHIPQPRNGGGEYNCLGKDCFWIVFAVNGAMCGEQVYIVLGQVLFGDADKHVPSYD